MQENREVTIVDYRAGNIGSIVNILKKVGAKPIVATRPEEIERASKIILPGVAAFDQGMANLKAQGLIEILNRKALDEKVPFLGVCLGMQLLLEKSEEGSLPGLGWVKGQVKRFTFPQDAPLRVPHMGWNFVRFTRQDGAISECGENQRFYFAHSYFVDCSDSQDILAQTQYGAQFTSVLRKGNLIGAQFHPEKSHKYGMRFFQNFVTLV